MNNNSGPQDDGKQLYDTISYDSPPNTFENGLVFCDPKGKDRRHLLDEIPDDFIWEGTEVESTGNDESSPNTPSESETLTCEEARELRERISQDQSPVERAEELLRNQLKKKAEEIHRSRIKWFLRALNSIEIAQSPQTTREDTRRLVLEDALNSLQQVGNEPGMKGNALAARIYQLIEKEHPNHPRQ